MNLYYFKVEYDESKMNTVNSRGTINNRRQRICIANNQIIEIRLNTGKH